MSHCAIVCTMRHATCTHINDSCRTCVKSRTRILLFFPSEVRFRTHTNTHTYTHPHAHTHIDARAQSRARVMNAYT